MHPFEQGDRHFGANRERAEEKAHTSWEELLIMIEQFDSLLLDRDLLANRPSQLLEGHCRIECGQLRTYENGDIRLSPNSHPSSALPNSKTEISPPRIPATR